MNPGTPNPRPGTRWRGRQRGSVYILVLGVSLLVTVLGVSALMATRVERDRSVLDRDAQQARRYAESAIDLALLKINNDTGWRGTYTHDSWTGEQAFGTGAIDWKLVDPTDTDLADDASQNVDLVALGKVGEARQMVQVTLQPPASANIEALRYGAGIGGNLTIPSGKSLVMTGGDGARVDTFDNQGTLVGNLQARLIQNPGVVSGGASTGQPALAAPPAGTTNDYIAIATALPFSGNIDGMVIAPGRNEYGGGTHPDGVYYIDTGNSGIVIQHARVHGTLIINAGTGLVKIDDQVFLHPARDDYPALIVLGDLEMNFTSSGSSTYARYLRESDRDVNYNPSGAAYLGHSDTDDWDWFPSEIRGLVHVTGNVDWKQTGRVRGSLLVEGGVNIHNAAELVYGLDPSVLTWKYTDSASGPMTVVGGSWRRVVDSP